ncbi:putative membrane protein [Streptomyces phaeoluteigriseus]
MNDDPGTNPGHPDPLKSVHWGTRAGMASTTDRVMSLRAVRQLRRVRTFYTAGALLWAVLTAWTAWQSPGSRQMWVSALLLAAFSTLLLTASLWLHRLQTAGLRRPAHHAKSRATAPRHAHA